MAMLGVQQFGHASGSAASGGDAGMLVALAALIVATAATVLFVGDWRRLHRSLGAQLIDEVERWLRRQPPPS